jgi:F-type H+-transporting ATPase subunit b
VKKCLGFLLVSVAAVAVAAEEGGAHPAGIPWWEIFKQAVNLAILVGIIVYFIKKPFSTFLAERSAMLRKSIDDAARARAEAAYRLTAIQEQTARLSEEIDRMKQRAEAEAADEARRIREAASGEGERIRTQARFAADQEVKKAREELRREAAELAARTAGEILARGMTPEDQERLVRENIEKVREIVK